MLDALGPLAASWGVLMAISPGLQIRRMLHRHSSADVSISYLVVLEIGFALWLAYGISLRNLAIIVPNCVAFVVGLLTIVVAMHLRAESLSAEPDPDGP